MDALDRLQPAHVERVEDDIRRIRSRLHPGRASVDGYRDVKAAIHCHTHLSHDCEGSIDEIARAAGETGTEVVMVTDHARPGHDVVEEGVVGTRSGVLFIPGAEARNLLIFFAKGLDYSLQREALLRQACGMGGMVFLSHLEGLTDWDLPGLHGTEIYNLHASFMGQERIKALYRSQNAGALERLLEILRTVEAHPGAGLGALCERPDLYLDRWDAMNFKRGLTGIAANDSHANNTMTIRRLPGGGATVEDFRGERIAMLRRGTELPFKGMDSLTVRPDSYEASLGHVGTHLLLRRIDETSVRDCLANGRCYIAFDWIADPRGFTYGWEGKREAGLMGEEVSLGMKPRLLARLPVEARLVLKVNGLDAHREVSDALEYVPTRPGSYRLEAYLNLGGEERPWILSNPIHVRE